MGATSPSVIKGGEFNNSAREFARSDALPMVRALFAR